MGKAAKPMRPFENNGASSHKSKKLSKKQWKKKVQAIEKETKANIEKIQKQIVAAEEHIAYLRDQLDKQLKMQQDVEMEANESSEDDAYPSKTFEELHDLAVNINQLPSDKINEIIDLIKKLQPKLFKHQTDPNECCIEFMKLKPKTVAFVEKIVKDYTKPKPLKRLSGPVPEKKAQLEQLEQAKLEELKNCEDKLGIQHKKVVKEPTPPVIDDSSDDSDSSSSSGTDSSSSSSDFED